MNTEVMYGFNVSEFVPSEIFRAFGVNSWWFIDTKVVLINAQLKKDFNAPIIINNWRAGGSREFCGYRPITCKIGGDNSQHRHGRASDTIVQGYSANEVREHIIKHKDVYMPLGLTTLEDKRYAPTWVHIDTRWTGLSDILIVVP
jgi:hypothetical protein